MAITCQSTACSDSHKLRAWLHRLPSYSLASAAKDRPAGGYGRRMRNYPSDIENMDNYQSQALFSSVPRWQPSIKSCTRPGREIEKTGEFSEYKPFKSPSPSNLWLDFHGTSGILSLSGRFANFQAQLKLPEATNFWKSSSLQFERKWDK